MKNYYFSENIVKLVWSKGIRVQGYDPNMYRKDIAGAWMKYADYGDTNSDYGWEIDHIYPKSLGGSDSIANLQPMHWMNNREKGDNYPRYSTVVTAQDNINIKCIKYW